MTGALAVVEVACFETVVSELVLLVELVSCFASLVVSAGVADSLVVLEVGVTCFKTASFELVLFTEAIGLALCAVGVVVSAAALAGSSAILTPKIVTPKRTEATPTFNLRIP